MDKYIEYKSNKFTLFENKNRFGIYTGCLCSVSCNPVIEIPEYIEENNIKYYITSCNHFVFKQIQSCYPELKQQVKFNIDPKNKFLVIDDNCFYYNCFNGNNPFDISNKYMLQGYFGYNKNIISVHPNTTLIYITAFAGIGDTINEIIFGDNPELKWDNVYKSIDYLPNLNYIKWNNTDYIKDKNNKWVIK